MEQFREMWNFNDTLRYFSFIISVSVTLYLLIIYILYICNMYNLLYTYWIYASIAHHHLPATVCVRTDRAKF